MRQCLEEITTKCPRCCNFYCLTVTRFRFPLALNSLRDKCSYYHKWVIDSDDSCQRRQLADATPLSASGPAERRTVAFQLINEICMPFNYIWLKTICALVNYKFTLIMWRPLLTCIRTHVRFFCFHSTFMICIIN